VRPGTAMRGPCRAPALRWERWVREPRRVAARRREGRAAVASCCSVRREQLQSVVLGPFAGASDSASNQPRRTSRAELAAAAQRPELPRHVGATVGAKRRRSSVRLSEHPRPCPAEMASPASAQLKSVVGDLDCDGLVSLLSKLIGESARLQNDPARCGGGST
jgi:hypothetical protein